jgi:hypothetical protein
MGHYPLEVRQACRRKYIYERKSMQICCDELDITLRTGQLWKHKARKEGDDWDVHRDAWLMAGEGQEFMARKILQDYLLQHEAVLKDLRDDKELKAMERVDSLTRLADAFAKTMNAVSRATPQMNRLATASEVVQVLSRFVTEEFPQHAPALLEVLEPFSRKLAKLYG